MRHCRVISNDRTEMSGQTNRGMTMTANHTIRRFVATFAVAASFVTISSASFAYTAEQQRLCTGDAFKFCSSEIPNIEKITMCMRKNKANLSTGCKSVFDKTETPTSKVADKTSDKSSEQPQF